MLVFEQLKEKKLLPLFSLYKCALSVLDVPDTIPGAPSGSFHSSRRKDHTQRKTSYNKTSGGEERVGDYGR